MVVQWQSGRLEFEESLIWDSPEALCCVREQDTISSALIVLVQPTKMGKPPDLTEKLLTGM